MTRRDLLILVALTMLGLLLRLAVWRWREFYGLGGDEQEYFEQALALLRGDGYRELQLMRPPSYTLFLALVFQVLDSQVQRVRLVQALISSATIPLFWLLARELFWEHRRRAAIALLATALAACCYTLAANATELLTETLFVGGLTLALWLLVLAARLRSARIAAVAGLLIGLLCLLRSVALPLVPLAALYFLVSISSNSRISDAKTQRRTGSRFSILNSQFSIRCSLFFVLGALLVVVPWTIRNYVRYDALIVVDTTGAENLWLDNDPAGRDAVKRQLYELGDDRGLRQRISIERGREAIAGNLPAFAAKAWSEATKFVALEYFDDLRQRRAIWVRPADVWLRLLLGDALWLLIVCGGVVGLWLAPAERAGRADPRWLLVPWALYVFVTGLVFHVELRYRLPLYPVLLPFSALVIVSSVVGTRQRRVPSTRAEPRPAGAPVSAVSSLRPLFVQASAALISVVCIIGLLLAHRNYPRESTMLARKHWHLRQAHDAVLSGRAAQAHLSAERALELDPESALARVYLGRSSTGDEASRWWREAIDMLPAHPYAHLLLGDALRGAGNDEAARAELVYETSSLEDLQRWSHTMFEQQDSAELDIGGGLDLGAIGGFYPAHGGSRWTGRRSEIFMAPSGTALSLRVRSPRPAGAPPAVVDVLVNGERKAGGTIGGEWQQLGVQLEAAMQSPVVVSLRSTTFRPRDYNRADGDNRELGVEVDWVR